MQYRRLGKSGLKLSALSFGSWVTFATQLGDESAEELMAHAYDAGVNFFDNAEAYASGESERIMGRVLAKMNWPRDTWCVSSKVFWGGDKPNQSGLSRKHVFEACHAALKRLQVEYLDLYFCHRPDPETPIEETVRAMHDLITQGKVLYWGTSEWSAQQIQEAWGIARRENLIPPTMEQPQYNMLHRERLEVEYAPLFENEIGLGTTIWSPLALGVLTGKYNDGIPEGSRASLADYAWFREQFESEKGKKNIETARRIGTVAKELGVPQAQLALAWCLKNDHVSTVILGATRLAQLKENLASLDVVDKLDDDILARLDEILGNSPTPT